MSILKKLNVGCGRNPFDGPEWTNVDITPNSGVVADLEKPWPFPDDSFDELYCSHVLEHIRDPLYFMQEAWRVARAGATMRVLVPYGTSDAAWEDPTHVRPYFVGSFYFFSQLAYNSADYGYRGDWDPEVITLDLNDRLFKNKDPAEVEKIMRHQRNVVEEMIVDLRAIKPMREPNGSGKQMRVEFNFI